MIWDGNSLPICPVCNSRKIKYEKVTGLEHDKFKHRLYVFTLCHCLACDHWFTIKDERDENDKYELEKEIEESKEGN